MPSGTRLIDKICTVGAFDAAVPSSAVPLWVSLKGYDHVQVILRYKNATTVTGAAIGLSQATAVAGTGAKVLPFTTMFSAVNANTTFPAVQTAVVSNTFTTDATNSQSGFYIIEVDAITLDIQNQYDCFQVTIGNGVAATISAIYEMGVSPRYSGGYDSMMNPLLD